MNKNLKYLLIILAIIIIAALITFFVVTRKMQIKNNVSFKSVYNTNYEDSTVTFVSVLDTKISEMEKEDKVKFFDALKEKSIKQIVFSNRDRENVGDAYRMVIKTKDREFKFVIAENKVNIGDRRFATDENLMNVLKELLEKYI